jgi:site-specific DNA-methyltransferase (adenine-specific)
VTSIKEFPEMLEARPIVVNPDMIVLGGNMRLKAAKAAGLTEAPVYVATWEESKAKEFIVKDNVGFGEWDWDILANEWDATELDEWGLDVWQPEEEEVEGLTDPDEVPEAPEEPKTKLGDLYILGGHRLLCGDSTKAEDVEKLMNGKKIDMVFTDPPYNIDYQGVAKGKHDKIANDKMSDKDFTQFLVDSLGVVSDTFYVCCSWQFSHLFRNALDEIGKPTKSFIIWDKKNPAQNLDKYYKQHEIILYHGKFGGEKTLRGDVWQIKRERNTVHPTMKPIELILIALKDNEGKKNVYDGFLGSGSTLIACEQIGRKCYGMEIDPKYCDVIVKRWEDFTGKKAIKENQ